MALRYNYCGMTNSPGDSVRLVVNADSGGLLQAVVEGVPHDGDTIDPGVMDGTGRVDITGLAPGRTYDVDILIDGVHQKTTKAKTLRSDFARVVFASCLAPAAFQRWAEVAKCRQPDVVHMAGDFDYEDNPAYSVWQEPVVVCTDRCLDIDNRYRRIRNRFVLAEVQALLDTGCMWLFEYDDHEMFNSWVMDATEPDMAALRHPGVIDSPPTIQQLLDVWRAHRPYLDMLHYGNPDLVDAVEGDVPTGAAGTDAVAADFVPRYFRVDLPGLCRLMALDVQTFRSPLVDPDNGSQSPIVKTCLGSTQRNWTATHGAASALPFNLLLTGKYFWPLGNEGEVGDRGWDRWNQFPSERDWLAAEIAGWPASTPTIAGDVHIPNVASDGAVWNLCACPCGVETVKRDTPFGPQTSRVYSRGNSEVHKFVAEIDITPEKLSVSLIDVMRPRKLKPWVFKPGSHLPVQSGTRMAAA